MSACNLCGGTDLPHNHPAGQTRNNDDVCPVCLAGPDEPCPTPHSPGRALTEVESLRARLVEVTQERDQLWDQVDREQHANVDLLKQTRAAERVATDLRAKVGVIVEQIDYAVAEITARGIDAPLTTEMAAHLADELRAVLAGGGHD